MKGLMVAVAACAFILWAGLRVWDTWDENEMVGRIRSGTPAERRTAAVALASVERESDIDRAFSALIGALDDEDPEVRAVAAHSLGSLIYQLRDHPPGAPIDPARLKGRIEVAMRVLVPLLTDRDPRIRAAAATGLEAIARRGRTTPPPGQVAALKHGSNAVRRQAAESIYGVPAVTLPSELVAALKDASAEVREAAAKALESFGPSLDSEIPTLLAMMEHDEPAVRLACSRALSAAWPGPAHVPTLIAALASRDPAVRHESAVLLGRIGPEGKAAIPALIAVLNEPLALDRDKRQVGYFAFYPNPAAAAARALGQMGPSRESVAALAEALSPENLERRPSRESVAALAKMFSPENVVRLIASWNAERLVAAAEGLGEIGPSAGAAVPALIALYEKVLASQEHVIGWSAIPGALARIAPNSPASPAVVAVLVRALDSKDQLIRLGAVGALGQFGKDAAAVIPKLRAVAKVSNANVIEAAKKSVAALEGGSPLDTGRNRTP
jgi:HEAT repeat protein